MKLRILLLLLFINCLCGNKLIEKVKAQPSIFLDLQQPPDDQLPKLTVLKKDNPAPGEILLSTYQLYGTYTKTYLLIVDNDGNALFHFKPDSIGTLDFKIQNGLYTYFDEFEKKTYAVQSLQYFDVKIDSFQAENFGTDGHDFRLRPNGGYIVLALDSEHTVLNNKPVIIVSGVLQEFDPDKKLVFQWNTAEHFKLTDALHEPLSASEIDFTHCNAIELDGDTAYLLSSRNLDEITKISKKDSSIIWRFGGVENQFTIIGDSVHFTYQHAVRRLRNGNIVLFDNGTYHPGNDLFSRAVEYKLDETNKTATKVWEYRHTPDLYGEQFGYVQELDNGNRLICWGKCDSATLTEVKPDGSTALEMRFDPRIYSYRAYKYNLQAKVVQQTAAADFSLDQNFPNPCSNVSEITFHSNIETSVSLRVYDALGRLVRILFDGTVLPGSYASRLETADLPNGTYFYQLSSQGIVVTKMLTVAK